MGLLGLKPTLSNPRHNHAHKRCPGIHGDNSRTEGGQRLHVMELDHQLRLRS